MPALRHPGTFIAFAFGGLPSAEPGRLCLENALESKREETTYCAEAAEADGALERAAARPAAVPAPPPPLLQITYVAPGSLTLDPRNPRTHSKKQIQQIAASIKEFGFTNPVLVDEAGRVLAGHGRLAAAKLLGLAQVPMVRLEHLRTAQKRAYLLADNKIAENAGWDQALLVELLQELAVEAELDLTITGFETAELDLVLADNAAKADKADELPPPGEGPTVTCLGDLWLLGKHRLICGDATKPETYAALLGDQLADLVFCDPPYNVKIQGHVSGLGRHRHREFAMASGEMTEDEFTAFLETSLGHMARHSRDGAIHFVCMDWRHLYPLLAAGRRVYSELKQTCVWAKSNAGLGSLYRSQTEFVAVFKRGTAPHINNVNLGVHRYRTSLWSYPGFNAFGAGRDEALAMHPTVKPVALVADAILDCSRRGGIVCDNFAGSGTTLLAAEKTGRLGRAIELDPIYCDVALVRYRRLTGEEPVLAATGRTFTQTKADRLSQQEANHG